MKLTHMVPRGCVSLFVIHVFVLYHYFVLLSQYKKNSKWCKENFLNYKGKFNGIHSNVF